MRPKRSCPTPDCPNLTTGGPCPDCRLEARRARGDRRPSASQRGYGREWFRTRARYLRDHRVCEDCGAPGGKESPLEVHHLDGRGPNGPAGHDETNLRALCKPCHSRHTAADQPGGWNQR